MKLLLVFMCGLILISAQAKIYYGQFKNECVDELNADDEKIAKALEQLYMPEHDRVFKAVLECIWFREGILDEDGNLIPENFRHFLVNHFKSAEHCHFLVATLVTADALNHCQHVKGLGGQLAVRLNNCIIGRMKYLETHI